MKLKLFILTIFLLSASHIIAQVKAKVIGISDGDTITVLLSGNIQKN